MMLSRTLLLLLIPAVALAQEVDVEHLVSVKVKGTTIDIVPNHIDVIVANPGKSAKELITLGGTATAVRQLEKSNQKVSNVVSFRGILHIFMTPEEWKATTNAKFETGDVVYTFFFDSLRNRYDFVSKHKLKTVLELKRKNEQTGMPLYVASPKYYVMMMTETAVFTCSMHPQINVSDSGKCPICAMDLIRTKAYK